MRSYQNLQGNSGVEAFELLPGGIRVRFSGGDVYVYTIESAGAKNIKEMQKLALEGKGLSTFISRNVKERYLTKET